MTRYFYGPAFEGATWPTLGAIGHGTETIPLGTGGRILQNCSGADPMAAIGIYGEQVLPKLRE